MVLYGPGRRERGAEGGAPRARPLAVRRGDTPLTCRAGGVRRGGPPGGGEQVRCGATLLRRWYVGSEKD